MDGPRAGKLADILVEKTKEGPWLEWRDRIAMFGARLGVSLARLHVGNSPHIQAWEVAVELDRMGQLDALEEALK